MSLIQVKSPTRVDLAGGTLDLWPLYCFLGEAVTVNVAIDIWTYADLNPRTDSVIVIESLDLKYKKEFPSLEDFLRDPAPELKLYRPLIRYFKPQKGFELKTKSESPVGGGLGGSSSLTISIIKAFAQWLGRSFKDVSSMVWLAHNFEAEILNTPTGTQDYFPAASGGLNVIHYKPEGMTQSVFPIKGSPLEKYFLLVYTGKSHHSGINNFEVLKSAIQGDEKTFKHLRRLSEISLQTEKCCLEQRWSDLPALFREEYKARVQLAPAFSSPEIEKLHRITTEAGAEAVKICGAGGGGCVLVWVSPENRKKVEDRCQSERFQVLNSRPVEL